ncbi:MAG TPA: c-type cytochrome [Dehalococcoidia bacterium]|nr:c-type cytochrome [Dehalococcoidia bacterium]
MNTAKQVNVMIGLLFVGLLGTFGYFLFDNGFNALGIDFEGRESTARIRQERINVERGGHLYALNCRSCHGLTGQGALENAGLPGAPLNLSSVRPPEASEAEVAAFADRYNATIHCGRVGTLMPPWSTDEEGPLNDFQIEQLVMLITSEFSEEGWEFAVEEGNHSDVFDPHKTLEVEIGEDDRIIVLNDASGLDNVEFVRIGGDTIDEPYEVLAIVEVDAEEGTVEVERGAQNSAPLAHEAGAEVYNGPLAPPDGPIVGESGTPPCGQAAARPAGGGETFEVSGDVTLVMGDNFFEYEGAQNPTFEVSAGDTVSFTLPNEGSAIHNLRIAGPDGEYETDDDLVSDPDLIPGGAEGTLEFAAGEAGTSPYRCDLHPVDMAGEVILVE